MPALKRREVSMGFDFTYLSLGAGVQSSALAAMIAVGEVEPVDVMIFADTQDEPRAVYEHLWRLSEWLDNHGQRVEVISAGRLSDNVRGFKMLIPAFTHGAGMLRRQCTNHFKITPIQKRVRELLGYKPRQRMRHKVRSLHGISIDEIYRMKPSREKWLTIEYPLVERNISRQTCHEIFTRITGLPSAPRSACIYCPYHNDREWLHLKQHDPAAWEFAVEYDKRIRNCTKAGAERPVYLHRSCVPLDEVNLDIDNGQMYFNGECEGMCGI